MVQSPSCPAKMWSSIAHSKPSVEQAIPNNLQTVSLGQGQLLREFPSQSCLGPQDSLCPFPHPPAIHPASTQLHPQPSRAILQVSGNGLPGLLQGGWVSRAGSPPKCRGGEVIALGVVNLSRAAGTERLSSHYAWQACQLHHSGATSPFPSG